MGKKYLIDSNIVIDYLDNKLQPKAMSFMNDVVDEVPLISVVTKIEVLRFNAPEAAYSILRSFIDESIIVGLDDVVVGRTIEICRSNKIKLPDAIIAATAISNDLTLLTRNADDFNKIAGVRVLNPWKF